MKKNCRLKKINDKKLITEKLKQLKVLVFIFANIFYKDSMSLRKSSGRKLTNTEQEARPFFLLISFWNYSIGVVNIIKLYIDEEEEKFKLKRKTAHAKYRLIVVRDNFR